MDIENNTCIGRIWDEKYSDSDKILENIIQQMGDVHIEQGNTLEEQIAIVERKKKLED